MATIWSITSWGERLFALAQLVPLGLFAFCTLYLWRLLLWAAPGRARVQSAALRPESSPVTVSAAREPSIRFLLLVPAHNEALVLGAALRGLCRLRYPRAAYQVVVVADNCSDDTAQIARDEGAQVLERFDTERQGKGYALEWALERLNSPQAAFDAVVVLDADTIADPGLLEGFARRITTGERVIQARYDVLNADESWRTRLMACALALAHVVKPLGRERLGLSDGLKGNGMCFAREVVCRVPWSGASITEDIEYTIRLCRAGDRVAFAPEISVRAQMPSTAAQAVTQRKRWEGGRYRLLFHTAPALLRDGVRARNRVLCDRALDLIIPPFAELFAVPALFAALCGLAWWGAGWRSGALFGTLWTALLTLQAGYLFGGLWVARVPGRIARAALYAPLYIVWKFGVYSLMALRRSAGGWQRTDRRSLQ